MKRHSTSGDCKLKQQWDTTTQSTRMGKIQNTGNTTWDIVLYWWWYGFLGAMQNATATWEDSLAVLKIKLSILLTYNPGIILCDI